MRLEPVDDFAAGGLPHALAGADVAQHLVQMPDAPGLAHDPRVQVQHHQPPGGRAIGIEPVKPLAPQEVDFVDRAPAVQVDVVVVEIGVDAKRVELALLCPHLRLSDRPKRDAHREPHRSEPGNQPEIDCPLM
jgi:hypothetical protein